MITNNETEFVWHRPALPPPISILYFLLSRPPNLFGLRFGKTRVVVIINRKTSWTTATENRVKKNRPNFGWQRHKYLKYSKYTRPPPLFSLVPPCKTRLLLPKKNSLKLWIRDKTNASLRLSYRSTRTDSVQKVWAGFDKVLVVWQSSGTPKLWWADEVKFKIWGNLKYQHAKKWEKNGNCQIFSSLFDNFCKKYGSQRYQNLYSSSHPYSLQMFFSKNVSITKKSKLKIVPTPLATPTPTTSTVPWYGLRRRQKMAPKI